MTSLSRSCATSRLEPWTDTQTHTTTTVTLAAHARRGLIEYQSKKTHRSYVTTPKRNSVATQLLQMYCCTTTCKRVWPVCVNSVVTLGIQILQYLPNSVL